MTTKEKVLFRLTQAQNSNDDKTISGEKLAEECGLSRAAIWKAVKSLREEGFQIEGSTNGGYFLCNQDIFTPELFKESLKEDFPEFSDCHSEVFTEIDSTNTYAKRILSDSGNLRNADGSLTQAGEKYHKSIILAESQTAGRGRLGRTFISPAKSGIYLSIIYAPQGGITNPAKLTAFSAVAVCRAIKEIYKIETQIKWINDIYAGGKKICGILTEGFTNFETGTIESAIIGIGINIRDNPEIFPPEVARIAGSIEAAELSSKSDATLPANVNSSPSRCKFAAHVAANVLKILEEPLENVMEEYKKASFLIGQNLTVHPIIGNEEKDYKAKAIDIDQNAGLLVELADGSKKTLSSGEVTLSSGAFVK
ncbi:MAG: biotin--[acetyl-CoA-carboxylase] ligase [Treponema sp.]|nr:biotin--[acetyl-CoA-carboxylase] ligase [Treponema sp.]